MLMNKRTIRVGILGDFSCGKSMLLNALLRYPLLPVSASTMTDTASTVRYSRWAFLEVWRNGKQLLLLNWLHKRLGRELLEDLKRFYIELGSNGLLENYYYFSDETGGLRLSEEKLKHNIMLAATFFLAYIPEYEELAGLHALKQNIMSQYFGGPEEGEFLIRIGWKCRALKHGVCLADLPGMDSAFADGDQRHDAVIEKELKRCDGAVVIYGGKAMSRTMDSMMKRWLKERQKQKKPLPVILNVVNQSDSIANPDVAIPYLRQQIDKTMVLNGLEDTGCFFVSALLEAETRYLEDGIIEPSRQSELVRMRGRNKKWNFKDDFLLFEKALLGMSDGNGKVWVNDGDR